MANLHRSGDAFWTFHIFNYITFLSIQGLFRTMGYLFSSYDAAFCLGAFLVTGLVFCTGYLIPLRQMKKWMFWMVRHSLLTCYLSILNIALVLLESYGLRSVSYVYEFSAVNVRHLQGFLV